MDRSTVIELVSVTYTADGIGQQVPTETTKSVFCELESVTRSEWATAGQIGLKPEFKATMFSPDYDGQEIVLIGTARYGVYRTFQRKDEAIELYLERKAGV